ncbi:hypothetical protein G8759_15060 [Spirosoma aureum]|uniref:Thioredoxin domain-containing protein n=1 Tax=Spirosoma aureum TaxID=2692134 RepID=A0A6G9ANI4_9BACT|nr:hypothetical protein [Spirosoma aureum]QIP13835.1 hypothetical protein G8759_15060 [Spirosoma aureum]
MQTRQAVLTDWQVGYELGVSTAPTLIMAGQRFHGKLTVALMVSFI